MPVSFAPSQQRANHYYSMGVNPTYKVTKPATCLCYTYNHGFINNANNARGKIGTTASSFLASRKRI